MTEIFNRQDFLERMEGDAELAQEMLDTFMAYTPQQLQEIRQAWEAGNVARVEGQAHSLKGAAGSIGAEALQQAARRMELAGKNRALEQAGLLLEAVIQEFSRLQEVLEKKA